LLLNSDTRHVHLSENKTPLYSSEQTDNRQDLCVVEEVMEVLHEMQFTQPELFSTLRFRIGIRGEQDQLRIRNFGLYEGPDIMTRQILFAKTQHWTIDPYAFWSNPTHSARGTSSTGELIALYINAKSGDS
jgi:hypothetical protein